MITLPEIITQIDDGSDINDVAAAVTKTVLSDFEDIAATLLLPYVRDKVRSMRRKDARKAEDAAFGGGGPTGPEDGAAGEHDPLAALRALASESFWVPGDGLVSWSSATEAEHQARASWLRGKAGVLVIAAERHELAASVIRAAGVERLAEVPGFELVAV